MIGDVKFGHQFVNVSSQTVDYKLPNGSVTQVRASNSSIFIRKDLFSWWKRKRTRNLFISDKKGQMAKLANDVLRDTKNIAGSIAFYWVDRKTD